MQPMDSQRWHRSKTYMMGSLPERLPSGPACSIEPIRRSSARWNRC